jgi:hypothetical protein
MSRKNRGEALPEDLDGWLEGELPALLAGGGPPAEPRYLAARASRPRWRLRLASVPAVLGTKLLVGAGAIALAAAGVGVKTAVTGSPSPLVWSRGAQTVVHGCQISRQPHSGIGSCVSSAEATSHASASGTPPGLGRKAGGSPPGQSIASQHAQASGSAPSHAKASASATSHPTPSINPAPGGPSQP